MEIVNELLGLCMPLKKTFFACFISSPVRLCFTLRESHGQSLPRPMLKPSYSDMTYRGHSWSYDFLLNIKSA